MSPVNNFSSLPDVLSPIQQVFNRSLLKDHGPNRTTIKACTVLCEILETVCLDSMTFDSFANLFVSLGWLADDRVSHEKDDSPVSSREDLKAACIEASYNLIKYAPLTLITEALTDELFLKALSHSVSVFLSTALKEKSSSLKISSMKALEILLLRSHSLSESGKMSSKSLSSVYLQFLPGIALTISKIITSDDKHPQGLLKSLLSVFSLTLTIIKPNESISETSTENDRLFNNLRAVINQIIPGVIDHRSSQVKLALLTFVKNIFECASEELLNHLNVTLLEVPLRFSMDSGDKTLQNESMTFLYDIIARESVYDIVEGKAISILLNVANAIDTSNIKCLAAIFTLMCKSNRLDDFLSTPSHRNRLMYFFTVYTELLPVDANATTFDGEIEFKHISKGQIEQLTTVIGANVSMSLLMDFILDYLQCTKFESNSLFVCNLIIESALAKSSKHSSVQCNKLSSFHFESCIQLLEETVSTDKSASSPSTSCSMASTTSLKRMSCEAFTWPSYSLKNELSSKSFYKIYFALQGLQGCMSKSASETMEQDESRYFFNPLDDGGRKHSEMAQFILTILRVQSVSLKVNGTKVLFTSAQNVLCRLSEISSATQRDDKIVEKFMDKYLVDIIMLVDCETSVNPTADISSLLFVLSSYCKWSHVPLFKCLVDRLLEILDANYSHDAHNVLTALLVLAKWMKQAKEQHKDEKDRDTKKEASEEKEESARRKQEKKVIHQNCKCVQDYASLTTTACTGDASYSDSCSRGCSRMDIKCTHAPGSHQMYLGKLDCDEDDLLVNWKNFIRNCYKSESFEDTQEDPCSVHPESQMKCKKSKEEEEKDKNEKSEDDLLNEADAPVSKTFDEDSQRSPVESLMTKDILTRCVNLLATPDPSTRIVNLELIEITSVILDMLGEENLLLPLVHSGWRQLVIRLTDEASVARVALRVLLTLSSVCGDFIKGRTLADVMPKIISFLKAHVNDSCRKESKLGHRFTMVFQYQLEALNSLGKLVCNLPILGKNLWPIIAITMEYCKKDQLKELRDAATGAISLFRTIDPDAVYFYCKCSLSHSHSHSH